MDNDWKFEIALFYGSMALAVILFVPSILRLFS